MRHRRVPVAVGMLGWLGCELVEAVAARLLTRRAAGEPVTVVVLGFRNEDPQRPNWINRWRVRMGLRTVRRYGPTSRLLISGGDPAGTGVPEADLLARHARELGYVGEIELERESRTTVENTLALVELLRDDPQIALATNPLHALKARILLRRWDPSLGRRFVPAANWRFGELAWAKPLAVAVGLGDLLRRPAADEPRCPR